MHKFFTHKKLNIGNFVKVIFSVLCLVFSCMAVAQLRDIDLDEFNKSPMWENSSGEISDNPSLTKPFQGKNFICRDEVSFTPKEEAAASAAFSKFVEYVSRTDKVEDSAHKKERENLLDAAIKAGSWKARYLDSVWSFRFPKVGDSKENAFARLVEIAGQGIPIAAYKLGSYFGRQDDNMYYWFDAAIDRGSVNAMTSVGSTIVVQSKALRPIGKLMLECAVSKKHADAYNALGMLAHMEGRRLDAYRLWINGVNEGCKECFKHVEIVARAQSYISNNSIASSRDKKLSLHFFENDSTSEEKSPALELIKKFYSVSWFYEISELSDFYRRLPKQMEFHPDDVALFLALKMERERRAEKR